jgi:hypothetical protein
MQTLEAIYYITAGPLLLALVAWGLWSLVLTKRAISTTERRAVLTATTTLIERFSAEVMPKVDRLEDYIRDNGVTYYAAWQVHLNDGDVIVERTEDVEGMDEFLASIDLFLPACNALSAWASYFVNEAADEAMAYRTLSADYLHAAELFIPSILLLEKDSAHEDQLELYVRWRQRFEHEIAVDDARDALARMQSLGPSAQLKHKRRG